MLDSIKQFFQNMYDGTIGTLTSWYDSIAVFLSGAWDIALIIIALGLIFVIFKLLRYITVPAIILSEIIMLTVVISSMLALIAFLTTSLVAIYNRIYSLSEYINTSSGSVSCLGNMLDCLSVSGILSAYFTELFALFVVILFLRVSGVLLWAMDFISDKIWKLGVLLGLV